MKTPRSEDQTLRWPVWVRELLVLLAALGLPVGSTWGWITTLWKDAEIEILVSGQQYFILLAALIGSLSAILLLRWNDVRMIRRLRKRLKEVDPAVTVSTNMPGNRTQR